MQYTEKTLLRRATSATGLLNRVTADEAGWKFLHFEAHRFTSGQRWEQDTGQTEAALVVLGGTGTFNGEPIGGRKTVFDGLPHAVYLPPHTRFTLTATTELEVAYGWVPSTARHPLRLITPEDCAIEIRGGGNATRQINSIIPPGFDCEKLVVVEVYTPGGNWSSYPPHKHDEHREGPDGELLEADLEEIYFYKTEGFAVQRVYTGDGAIDSCLTAQDNDIVLVPKGYHPVSAAYGYDCYYLNFLAGSAQSLANSDDPDHAWTKTTWESQDPRVPLVGRA